MSLAFSSFSAALSLSIDAGAVEKVRDGGSTGDVTGGVRVTGVCAGSGAGMGALVVLVGVGVTAGAGVGTVDGAVPVVMAPVSRLTSFGGAVLPEKNSPAVRAGSAEGAGGKMSAWKESACGKVCEGTLEQQQCD